MPSLNELIVRLAELFDRLAIPYAFGGAVATSYWGTGRTTQDADCLVSVPAIQFQTFADELNSMGCVMPDASGDSATVSVPTLQEQITQRGYMAVDWNTIRAELFVPRVALQNEILRRAVLKPIEDRQIKVTTAEDLVLLKMAFHRQKDIQDVKGILYLQKDHLDWEYLNRWSEQTLADEAVRELQELIASYAGNDEESSASDADSQG